MPTLAHQLIRAVAQSDTAGPSFVKSLSSLSSAILSHPFRLARNPHRLFLHTPLPHALAFPLTPEEVSQLPSLDGLGLPITRESVFMPLRGTLSLSGPSVIGPGSELLRTSLAMRIGLALADEEPPDGSLPAVLPLSLGMLSNLSHFSDLNGGERDVRELSTRPAGVLARLRREDVVSFGPASEEFVPREQRKAALELLNRGLMGALGPNPGFEVFELTVKEGAMNPSRMAVVSLPWELLDDEMVKMAVNTIEWCIPPARRLVNLTREDSIRLGLPVFQVIKKK
jgi:hypothetical protein